MKTLLVNPPYSLADRYGKLKHFGGIAEPMGLAYLAASLEKEGLEVRIADCQEAGLSPEDLAQMVKEQDIGLVGITMLTTLYQPACETARVLKEEAPDVNVIIGGAHPSVRPEETLREATSTFSEEVADIFLERDAGVAGADASSEVAAIDSEGDLYVTRHVVIGERFYHAIFVGPPSQFTAPETRRFLDSFTVSER